MGVHVKLSPMFLPVDLYKVTNILNRNYSVLRIKDCYVHYRWFSTILTLSQDKRLFNLLFRRQGHETLSLFVG